MDNMVAPIQVLVVPLVDTTPVTQVAVEVQAVLDEMMEDLQVETLLKRQSLTFQQEQPIKSLSALEVLITHPLEIMLVKERLL
jgi:hypothetical protein